MSRFTPTVELALGADLTADVSSYSWTDNTEFVWLPAKVVIQRGRQDRYAQTQPARCSLTLINQDGRFTPRNPVGAHYGRLARNTPLRVLVRPNVNGLSDAFDRTSASSWASADSGGSWTNTGGSAADFSVSPTNGGRHLHTSANDRHYSRLGLSIVRSDQTVKVRVNALSTGAAQTAGLVCRYVDASNSKRGELQFGTTGTITGRVVSRSSGTDTVLGSKASTLTHSTSTWYWLRMQVGLTSVRLKVWQDGSAEPATWLLDAADGVAFVGPVAGTLGCHSIRETSNTNASATIDFDAYSMVDGPRIQFTGFVDQWPVRWADHSLTLSLAPITATGQLRRIGLQQTLRSALFRAHTLDTFGSATSVLVGCWPCEDVSGATSIASAISGHPAARFAGSNFALAADSTIAGSDPLPTIGADGSLRCTVPAYPASTVWAIRAVIKLPTGASGSLLYWGTPTGSGNIQWALSLDSGTDLVHIAAINSAGTDVIADAGTPIAGLRGKQLYVEANATQNGANIDWSYNFWLPSGTGAGGTGTLNTATVGNVTQVHVYNFTPTALGDTTVGHIAVATSVNFGASVFGANGYDGELTSTRFQRLCIEQNVSSVFGDLVQGAGSTVQTMGAQRTTSLIQQLREVEATESGILYDGKQGQVHLLPRTMRQSHAVDLTLDVGLGQVGWPLDPTDDDYLLRNDVTASRVGGSTARATEPASVQAFGVYPDSVSINSQHDDDLRHHAAWRLNVGTAEDLRYPQVVLDLTRSHLALADDWLDCDIGGRVQITGIPADQLPPDNVDLIVEGYTEFIDSVSWTATLNTSPAAPWTVFQVEDNTVGRLDTEASTLAASVSSGATSLDVATTTSGPLWSTTAVPYDIAVAGERMTVTGVASAIRDTFTRSASSGWGTADSGESWVIGAGTPALFSATGSVGQIAVSAINSEHHIAVNLGYAPYQRVRTYLTLGVTPTGAAINWGVMLRRADASNLYWIDVQISTTGSLTLRAISKIAAANTQLTTATSATVHSTTVARILVAEIDAANIIRAKVYADGAIEPGWELVYDASAVVGLSTGPSVGCIARLAAGNTNVGPVNFAFDNFSVLNPQEFTVTRSVNGVSKAQTTDADVALWRPGTGGLAL